MISICLRPMMLLGFVCVLVANIAPAKAADFVFSKIVDSNDPIPNGAGALFQPTIQPAIDGGIVVFRNGPSLAPDSVWSVTDGVFTKLVDLNTPVPGGTGNFSGLLIDFSGPGFPLVNMGTVVFAGRDSASTGYTGGLYSVPASGGTITRIANRNVAAPGGTGNFDGGFQDFSIDVGVVAFKGIAPGTAGLFTANVNGTSLTAVADVAHPAHPEFTFPLTNFNYPSIHNGVVACFATGVFDPSTGFNGIYTTSAAGGFSYGEAANSTQALPGDPTDPFHSRYGRSILDGGTIFFRADDSNTSQPNFSGIFSVASGGGTFGSVVDINTKLPGLTTVNSGSFNPFSARNGVVAFTAIDNNGNYGVYTHANSAVTKIIATDDAGPFADLHATNYAPTIGTSAIDQGQILLHTNVRFSAEGIYLVTPFEMTADLVPSITLNPSNASVGANVTVNVSLTNQGPATAQSVTLRATLPEGVTFVSAPGGVYDDITRAVTFAVGTLAPNTPTPFSVIATVNTAGPLTVSAYSNALTVDPDRKNNHTFATTNAVFSTMGNYVIRKIVDNHTVVPDRTGEVFSIPAFVETLPALDGNKVAFIATTNQSNSRTIWSANSDGSGSFTRLVDVDTDIPNGGGEKFGSVREVRLRNGNIVFTGFGANQMHAGIYAVPDAGGTIRSVAASGDPRPEGTGTFVYGDFLSNLVCGYMSDGRISFSMQGSIYVYPVSGNGTPLIAVYPGSNIPTANNRNESLFGAPALSGNRVVFQAGGRSLLGNHLDEHRFFAIADIATESPSTPGENFVNVPVDSFGNVQVEGNTVVFRAYSGTGGSIKGIYSVTGTGPVVKLVDTNTAVPGGNGNFTNFSVAGGPDAIGLSDGEVVFLGADAENRSGFYSVPATGGAITRIVAAGDTVGGVQILGNPSFFNPPCQANSLGEHQLVFRADFKDLATNSTRQGLFVAGRVQNRLANISTRLAVGMGNDVLIGGLIVSGSASKQVLVRGIGPSLGTFGVPNPLSDPTLDLVNGANGEVVSNDNWRDTQEQEIIATGLAPTNDFESAILATLAPGSYTAVLRGKNDTTGNGLVEVYDIDPSTELGTRLVNISSRGFVQTGDDVMIGGVIVQGIMAKHLLVRAIGPSLANFGVPNALPDTTLDVVDSSGTTLASNDNWRDTQETMIIETTIPPADDLESAIDIHLMPGNYTAVVRGKNNLTGNGLVEVYDLP